MWQCSGVSVAGRGRRSCPVCWEPGTPPGTGVLSIAGASPPRGIGDMVKPEGPFCFWEGSESMMLVLQNKKNKTKTGIVRERL